MSQQKGLAIAPQLLLVVGLIEATEPTIRNHLSETVSAALGQKLSIHEWTTVISQRMDQNITILLTGSFTLLLPVDHHAKGHITQ